MNQFLPIACLKSNREEYLKMMPSNNNSFCTLCYKTFNLSQQLSGSSVKIKLFYELLGRFVGDSYLTKLFVSAEELFGTSLSSCKNCEQTVYEFCAVYHKFRCLELQLEKILDKIVSTVQLANRIPTRWRKLSELFEKAFNNDSNRKVKSQAALRKVRQNIVQAGQLRSMKAQPRVKLESTKIGSDHSSRNESSGKLIRQNGSNNFENSTNTIGKTFNIIKDQSIITTDEQIQAKSEHSIENDDYNNVHPIPEPPSSLQVDNVITLLPIKKESNSCNLSLVETIPNFSPRVDKPLKQSRQSCIPAQRASRKPRDNESENSNDDTSDNGYVPLNEDVCGKRRRKKKDEFNVSNRPGQCNECKVWLKNRQALYRHKVRYHRDPFKCLVCKKSYTRIDNFKRHVLTLHGNSKHAKKIRKRRRAMKQAAKRNGKKNV